MSTCTRWVTTAVLTCKNWASKVDYECVSWADEGESKCNDWKDEGYEKCAEWGKECHWYTFWNCVVEWFCKGWYWVAHWVCKGWYWVAKWVCKAFAWVVKAICVVFAWVLQLVCVAWDWLRCLVRSIIDGVKSLFSGKRAKQKKIEHVFVLALENRSFDHMFGKSGITGVDLTGAPTTFNDGFNVASNELPNGGGTVFPTDPSDLHLKGVDKDPGHEWDDVITQLGGPNATWPTVTGLYPPIDNSGFVHNYASTGSATPERMMTCFSPAQLPVLNALAREFVVCDKWFSSMPGPTFPNRFFMMAASSGGLDGSPSKLDIVTATTVEGYRFENGNIFDLLDQHCIPWRIYEGDEFPASFLLSGMNLNALQGRFSDFEEFESDVQKLSFAPKFVFIEPKYGKDEFGVQGPGDFTCGNSMHPLDDVTRGERLIKDVYESIRKSPHWETSVLIVTFDEHGGFYDHVAPPPAVPPGDVETASYVQHDFSFDQLGVRVPALVISPHVPKGVIDHTVYDHTSILRTVEALWNMKPLTDRDRAANDLFPLLSLASPRTDAPLTLPSPARNPSPLPCDDESIRKSADALLKLRAELRTDRRREGLGKDRPDEFTVASTATGFLQVALLKVLQTAMYPERERWIADYLAIDTEADAALFMAEAQLQVIHGIDVKRFPDKFEETKRSKGRAGFR